MAAVGTSPVPTTKVTGPIPAEAPLGDSSRNYPFFSTSDLAERRDYIEEEFFVEGLASAFTIDTGNVATAIPGGPYPYKTRVMVRRPRTASRFNGTVILEWINAVMIRQYDFETDWNLTNEHLMRRGFVHVGASVQWFGVHSPVTGLKAWNPGRYGSLDITANGKFQEDELANSVFAQIANVVKNPEGTALLGSLRPQKLIATGQSASAGALATYYNTFQQTDGVLDGFVLHGAGRQLRTDIQIPVFKFMAETDVVRVQAPMRQPDSDRLRTWEVAGSSHLDVDIIAAHKRLRERDLRGVGNPNSAACPV
ncbi:MAG: alpha/beta hydrolase domain-containing protein, partial [Bryobacteraceae bacterium]